MSADPLCRQALLAHGVEQAAVSRTLRDVMIGVVDELFAPVPLGPPYRVVSLPDFLHIVRVRWREQILDRPVPSHDEFRLALRSPVGLIREGLLSVVPRRSVAGIVPHDVQPQSHLWVLIHHRSAWQ
ncbi:MAG TPA: hypothetical protein VGE52_12825 [Pirellulales bacterium]